MKSKLYKSPSLLVLLLMLTGCAATRHGGTTEYFEGFLVPVSSRPGAMRLQAEMDYDSTVRDFVSGKGKPDYIFVINRNQVKLVYMQPKEVATFTRSFSCVSKVSVTTGLTADITARLEGLTDDAFEALSN